MNSTTKILLNVGLGVTALVMGLGCAGALISMTPAVTNAEPPEPVLPVQIIEVQPADVAAVVMATGVVEAEQQVGLTPEVSGRVVSMSKHLKPGGRFRKGDTLLSLDARDYKAALLAQKAQVSQARLNVALEEKRVQTARQEWKLVGHDGEPEPLALRTPQLELAKANLDAAVAGMERAQLNVRRATLRAPFNAVVVNENVDAGQVVGPGAPIITLVGTDAARVSTTVPVDKLGAIEIPSVQSTSGSMASVRLPLGAGRSVVRTGQVSGLGGQLDPATRTASVFVTVQSPMDGDGLPLIVGSYVDVEITGRTVSGTTAIPRAALYNGSVVWVVTDGRLVRREVDIAWRAGTEVFVQTGLEPGDKLVVSALSNPLEGMKVSTSAPTASKDEG